MRYLVTDSEDGFDTVSKGNGDPEKLRHTVLGTVSTNDVDRDNEVIQPKGIDIKMFNKNKVMLWAHDGNQPPIGGWLWAKPERGQMKAFGKFADRPEFHPEQAEWFPDTIYSLFEQKMLRGFSIGFIPLDFRPPSPKEIEEYPLYATAKRVYTKTHLIEISACPVPCNPYCLAEAVSKVSPKRMPSKPSGLSLR